MIDYDKMLSEIEDKVTDGAGIRKFSSIDLIRFHKMASSCPPNTPGHILIGAYKSMYPELTARQKVENLFKALNMDCEEE